MGITSVYLSSKVVKTVVSFCFKIVRSFLLDSNLPVADVQTCKVIVRVHTEAMYQPVKHITIAKLKKQGINSFNKIDSCV